jgi:anti-anti-sigma factor
MMTHTSLSHTPTDAVSSHAHIAFDVNDEMHPQVVIVEFLSRAIADPVQAAELGQQLGSLIRPDLPYRFVLDFEDVRSFSSTGFGALVSFILKVRQAGGRVTICNMDEFVRFGADVIRLGDYAEFADDRQSAIVRLEEM